MIAAYRFVLLILNGTGEAASAPSKFLTNAAVAGRCRFRSRNALASMGPRSYERGRGPMLVVGQTDKDMLQWGRAHKNAEGHRVGADYLAVMQLQ
jgi:hypothetical protein